MRYTYFRFAMFVFFCAALAIVLAQFSAYNSVLIVAQSVKASGMQDDAVVIIDAKTGIKVNLALPSASQARNYERASNLADLSTCETFFVLKDNDPKSMVLVHNELNEPGWHHTVVQAPTNEVWYVDSDAINPSPDGRWVFIPSAHAGVIVDTKTETQTNIVLDAPNSERGAAGIWSPDSRFFIWRVASSQVIRAFRYDSEKQDLTSFQYEGISVINPVAIPARWSPDGQTLATLNAVSGVAGVQLMLIDAESLATRLYNFPAIANLAWSTDSEYIILIARLEESTPGFSPFSMIRLNTETGDWEEIKIGSFFIALEGEVVTSPDGRWMSIFLIEQETDIVNGNVRLAVIDREGKIRFMVPVPHVTHQFLASQQIWSADSRYYATAMTVAETNETPIRLGYRMLVGDTLNGSARIIDTEPVEAVLTWLVDTPEVAFVTRGVRDYMNHHLNLLNIENGKIRQFELGHFETDYQYGACE